MDLDTGNFEEYTTLGIPSRAARVLAETVDGPAALTHMTAREIAAAAGVLHRVPQWAHRIERLAFVARDGDDPYRDPLTSPERVMDLYRRRIGAAEQETFLATYLDSRTRHIETKTIAIGTVGSVSVHPRDVFRHALRVNAHSIVVGHNHPSGNPDPSEADRDLTSRLVDGGRLLGIPVVDHVIVCRGDYFSFARSGLI